MTEDVNDEPVRSEPWFAPVRARNARTVLVQIIVWITLLSGPVALFIQVTDSGPPVPPAGPDRSSADQGTSVAVAGWAERAVAAYAEGDLETVRTLYPTITDRQLDALPAVNGEPVRVSAVAVQPLDDDRWSVIVALYPLREDAAADPARHLSVIAEGHGTSWSAVDLPAELGVWTSEPSRESPYTPGRLADSALTEAVEGWAQAYLTGHGELDRYLAPDTVHPPITSHPAVEVRGVHPDRDDEETATAPPGDGDTVSVLVDLVVTDADGRTWPMTYALDLTSRSQRWEISALTHPPVT
ncbi:conjugal transfer protein [Nocardiopsis dassonvillei]|uniref:conjugal transfer protein n=1 Tax=Nocardiopsis dassonvillei TaxID=2014 RepID=UPI00200EF113|nr:conjugal transfer protein [Nocardiopsis dassonvillei]MCK9871356.1 conjugal transfer protein [Nocardiopsis dassonvillei]